MNENELEPKAISLKAIFLGFLADFIGTFSIGFLAVFIIGATNPTENAAYLVTETPVAGGLLFVSFLFSALGGYIAARFAKSRRVLHATWVGIIGAILAILTELLPMLASDEVLMSNLVLSVSAILVTVFAAYLGGRLYTANTHDPEIWIDSALRRVGLAGTSLTVSAILLILAFSYAHAYFFVPNSSCTVETLYIHGELYTTAPSAGSVDAAGNVLPETYSAGFADIIERIDKDKRVKAILIDVDSPGGSPVAGEEIANALKSSNKITVALIRSIGASAAYWAATGAQIIIASPNADVGSIGVSVNYLDKYRKNLQEGLNSNVITSAKFKSLGDPNLPLTDEQRAIIQSDVDEIHKNFVAAVSDNRKLSMAEVEKLADGATMLGSRALAAGLIDKLGDMSTVREYLAEKLGMEPKICESYYQFPQ